MIVTELYASPLIGLTYVCGGESRESDPSGVRACTCTGSDSASRLANLAGFESRLVSLQVSTRSQKDEDATILVDFIENHSNLRPWMMMTCLHYYY